MASEPSKSSATVAQDPQGQPHPIAPYPPQFAGAHYPPLPPGAYPPYYAYAPIPTDGSHDPSAPNGVPPGGPYLMAFPPPPPGMVYAYAPPPGQCRLPSLSKPLPYLTDRSAAVPGYPPFAPGLQTPVVLPRPKRKQVKMAVRFLSTGTIFFYLLIHVTYVSVPTAPAPARDATMRVRANVVKSMGLRIRVWMASGRRGKRESSGDPTNARIRFQAERRLSHPTKHPNPVKQRFNQCHIQRHQRVTTRTIIPTPVLCR